MDFSNIEELTWEQVRDKFALLEPALTQIIDDWNPDPAYTLFRISYPFGAKISNNGLFNIPDNTGALHAINSAYIPLSIQKALNYQAVPIGLVSDKSIEVFREIDSHDEQRAFTLAFFKSGLNLGIWETFGNALPYVATAGARSLFLLPKANDADNFEKMRRSMGLHSDMPRHLFEQGLLFEEIARRARLDWHCEVYFFSNKWLDTNTAGTRSFSMFILQRAWKQAEYARNRTVFEVSWQKFCQQLQERGLKVDPYLIELMRHLIFVGQGSLPGYKPAGASDVAGPITALQKIYLDAYGLKTYVPTFMHPEHFSLISGEPVYFSLIYPNILELVPRSNSYSSSIDHLRRIKELWSLFLEALTAGRLNLDKSMLLNLQANLQYDFFHSDMHTYGGIRPTRELPAEDPGLMYMPLPMGKRSFADKGQFIRCCIRISANR